MGLSFSEDVFPTSFGGKKVEVGRCFGLADCCCYRRA